MNNVRDKVWELARIKALELVGDRAASPVRRHVWDQSWNQVQNQVRNQVWDQVWDRAMIAVYGSGIGNK